jgi:hypothetical protein
MAAQFRARVTHVTREAVTPAHRGVQSCARTHSYKYWLLLTNSVNVHYFIIYIYF